jgi:hemerythrin-like domain-containing protein
MQNQEIELYKKMIESLDGTVSVLKDRHADLKKYASLLVNEIKDFMNGDNNKEQVQSLIDYLNIYIGE